MAGAVQNGPKGTKIAELFESMEYGPAPESDKTAQAWLDDHSRKLGHFINNEWVTPENRKWYETRNPCTGQVLAATVQGTEEDVNVAVAAARKAFGSWSQLSGHARARHIYSIARHLQKHARLMAVIASMDNGKTIRETRDCDVPIVIRHLYHHAGWAQLADTKMANWKPLGVVGAIVPWNFPLMLLAWKVCPALAMGNTVVLKPATYTRLSALLFAEICAEAGLPAGVFNVVTGPGSMGEKLATHPDVDKVGFTGSTEIGQRLRRATAGMGKKLSLELGGKSPVVVYDSADLDSAVEGVVDAIWFNQGQVCSAGSKLLVQERVFEPMMAKLRSRMEKLRLGDSLDKALDMGAIVDESQRRSVKEYVDSAKEEGAEVFQVGAPAGCFYPPTLITNVQTSSRVVVDEIFGPVLVALPFRTAKEALALANNTIYGLGGSVWTEKLPLALETAKHIKAGSVWINCHNMFDAATGFGGYRQSGYGRDGGKEGLYEYVKPRWMGDTKQPATELDMKEFGARDQPSRPDIGAAAVVPEISAGVPRVDRTYKLFYGGAQKRPDGNYSRVVLSADGSPIAQVAESNRKDVRNAVEAAHKGQPGWAKRSGHQRAQILYYLAENLELRRDEFVNTLVQSVGGSREAAEKEVDASVARLFHWAALSDKFGGAVQETQLYGTVLRLHEPVGVVAALAPDTAPLLAAVSLIAPLIARGNAVILVPSERRPLPALDLYQILETSDVPAGVVSLLTGSRDHLARHLSEHQDIQSVWCLAESAAASRFVEHTSAVNVKRTWVDWGRGRDWFDGLQGQGEEFLYHATQCKSVWLTMGDIFAN
ncbi:aldehyde dehydrogenase family 16 member A1-like [Amphibalanus amphitrite]|uniref:aldehyde dehydrogenase family 16 member A1-like n=1 Tax=Amphibalanus amphitrite TaxID=1232801 RepID=UPI001C909219|nr:aldehyde dehydrogenase family 16 member A1-like [Amphibalanus amphitrite]